MRHLYRFHSRCETWLIAIAISLPPSEASAYIDPGTTGLLSQVLYVSFYAALGVFFYFLKYIKSSLAKAKSLLMRWFTRHS